MQAVIALGTNTGDRFANLFSARKALDLLPGTKVLQCSAVYETKPWGYEQQQDFLNCALLLDTGLSPHALLGACLGIEAGFGRVRTFKNGPRIVDLDIIFYENYKSETDELTLPHPRFHERAFVLIPLADLFPEKTAFGTDFNCFYQHTDSSAVKKYIAGELN